LYRSGVEGCVEVVVGLVAAVVAAAAAAAAAKCAATIILSSKYQVRINFLFAK